MYILMQHTYIYIYIIDYITIILTKLLKKKIIYSLKRVQFIYDCRLNIYEFNIRKKKIMNILDLI